VSFWPSTCLASPLVSFSLSLAWMTSNTRAALALSLGMTRIALLPSQNRDIWSLHTLQAYRLYIIGVKNLRVEIDAAISGYAQQSGYSTRRCSQQMDCCIKLFQFELVHVPGRLHTGPDGLHAVLLHQMIRSMKMRTQMTGWIGQ